MDSGNIPKALYEYRRRHGVGRIVDLPAGARPVPVPSLAARRSGWGRRWAGELRRLGHL